MVVVESFVHGAFGSSGPYTVLVLMQNCSTASTESKAYDNRLGVGSVDAETGISFRVDHGILLSGLIQFARLEVFLGNVVVKSRIEVLYCIVSFLGLEVFIVEKGMIVYTQPRVAVAEVPECYVVNNIFVLAEYTENACILILLKS